MSEITLADAPDPLDEYPLSRKITYLVLDSEGEMTQQELADATALRQRTIRNAIADLEELGLIDSRPCYTDLRKSVYTTDE